MQHINSKEELQELARVLGVRTDWHEPDERNITARVSGTHLDNAMGADPYHNYGELTVILEYIDRVEDEEIQFASINLANLLAWASEGF